MKNKKGQGTMAMPFKMIFAIFLIIIFVVFAFMAVGGFLDIGKSSSVGMFYDELQEAVNDAMRSQSSEATFKIDLPKGITHICFANLSAPITPGEFYDEIERYAVYEANTFLIPPEQAQEMQWKLIKNIDIEGITSGNNPYCIDIKDDLIIKKDFYDRLVVIE